MDRPSLADRTAIVTGAASGIGRAIAEQFAAVGANVVIADVDADAGAAAAERIRDDGGVARFVETDVVDREAVAALVDATVETYGGLDALVNNAGGSFDDGRLHEIDEATWDRNVDVNLKGAFNVAQAAVGPMVSGGGGSMVHVSSVNGLTGIGFTAYSAAKSGMRALSKVIATQYGTHGVRSNLVCPGTIETEVRRREFEEHGGSETRDAWLERYALDRLGRPEDVADAALFLASDMSAWVTGTELVVDGGLTGGLDQGIESLVYDVESPP
jgi:3-oxoacyl-[acyl-carrier protein] reductase